MRAMRTVSSAHSTSMKRCENEKVHGCPWYIGENVLEKGVEVGGEGRENKG